LGSHSDFFFPPPFISVSFSDGAIRRKFLCNRFSSLLPCPLFLVERASWPTFSTFRPLLPLNRRAVFRLLGLFSRTFLCGADRRNIHLSSAPRVLHLENNVPRKWFLYFLGRIDSSFFFRFFDPFFSICRIRSYA